MQNVYSTQWIWKIKEILQRYGLFNIPVWVNQHNICIEDSKAISLLICTRWSPLILIAYNKYCGRKLLLDIQNVILKKI